VVRSLSFQEIGQSEPSLSNGMGVALDVLQGQTGYRSFELADMAANALGVAAGAAAALILPRAAGAGGPGTR
jgi:hypothetical protein